jgi:hypothetical protein
MRRRIEAKESKANICDLSAGDWKVGVVYEHYLLERLENNNLRLRTIEGRYLVIQLCKEYLGDNTI